MKKKNATGEDEEYLENAKQIRASELEGLTKEEAFEEGYLAAQTWNTLPITDATYKDSDELMMYVVKTRRRCFLSYEYDYFIAYFVNSEWLEIHTARNVEEGGGLKVIEWKPL